MKLGIKTLIVINLILGFFTVNKVMAQEIEQEVETVTEVQVEGGEKLQSLMEKIQMKKLALQKEIEELKQEPHTLIEIELISVSDDGQYWYDHSAENEPNVYVDWGTAEKFGVDDYEIGDTSVGIFDAEGWELFGFDIF